MSELSPAPAKEVMKKASRSVSRLALVLNAIAASEESSLSFTEILHATGISRATCHAVLTGLVIVGYLERGNDKRFRFGLPIARLGIAAQASLPPLEWALGPMQRFADTFSLTCSAFIPRGHDVVVRERVVASDRESGSVPRGMVLPLRPPFGATLLMGLDDEELDDWLQALIPAPAPRDVERLKLAIQFARGRGFAVVERRTEGYDGRSVKDQLFADGYDDCPVAVMLNLEGFLSQHRVTSIQAPILDKEGRVAWTIGAMGFSSDLTVNQIMNVGEKLSQLGGELSTKCLAHNIF